MAIEHKEETPAGAPLWMLTYGDMVTNLLCFFVLLFAMSKVDNEKMIGLMESLSETFNPKSTQANVTPTGPVDDPYVIGNAKLVPLTGAATPLMPRARRMEGDSGKGTGPSKMEKDLASIAEEIRKLAKEKGLEKQLTVEVNGRGVVVSFAETADSLKNVSPFDSGSAQLRAEFKAVLDRLAPLLQVTANKIEIQGHTDPRPIHTPAFPSNWELSGARAGAVVRYFVHTHRLYPDQFVCTGFADTAPVDRRQNAQAWARNRRIEIVVTRQPVELYNQATRDQGYGAPTDVTAPVGQDLVPTGLPQPGN